MWHVVFPLIFRDWTQAPASGAWSLSLWTTREVWLPLLLINCLVWEPLRLHVMGPLSPPPPNCHLSQLQLITDDQTSLIKPILQPKEGVRRGWGTDTYSQVKECNWFERLRVREFSSFSVSSCSYVTENSLPRARKLSALSPALSHFRPLTPTESHSAKPHSEGIESLLLSTYVGFGVTYIHGLSALFEAGWHILLCNRLAAE